MNSSQREECDSGPGGQNRERPDDEGSREVHLVERKEEAEDPRPD